MEEELFAMLIDIYRSPDTLLQLSGEQSICWILIEIEASQDESMILIRVSISALGDICPDTGQILSSV